MPTVVPNNSISFARRHAPASNKRHASIYFSFKLLDNGRWLMHMHADYVPAQDREVADPLRTILDVTNEWTAHIDVLLRKP